MRKYFSYVWGLLLLSIFAIGAYNIPFVHARLSWRIDEARTQIKYFFNPPDQAIFQPAQQVDFDSVLATTRANYLMTLTPQANQTPQGMSTPQPGSPILPTITSTPLPATVMLQGVKYEDQHNRWNYCGPANFSMALTFWGWKGNRDVVGKAVKPSDKDKNVMPYELQDFVAENIPELDSVMRYGGDVDVLKRFLAAGFPVVIEKGYYERDYTGKVGWMGHYQFVTGYDDAAHELIVQDTYNDGPNFHVNYEKLMEGWRAFNYLFVVVYPVERQNEVMTLLGDLADENTATRHALSVADAESQSLQGIDRFFASFNGGTSHVALREYIDAAVAYDNAFAVYNSLDSSDTTRPYRMMWYQTGPYWAYFYSNRFTDVINLASTTLQDTIASPDLEESLLWRGRAYYMAGQTNLAVADYRLALKVHPKWQPAIQALQDLGVQP